MKETIHYRAIARQRGSRGVGPLVIEASLDGQHWRACLAGVDSTTVQKTFERFKSSVIVDTEDFTFNK
jgi:hypothetical protein